MLRMAILDMLRAALVRLRRRARRRCVACSPRRRRGGGRGWARDTLLPRRARRARRWRPLTARGAALPRIWAPGCRQWQQRPPPVLLPPAPDFPPPGTSVGERSEAVALCRRRRHLRGRSHGRHAAAAAEAQGWALEPSGGGRWSSTVPAWRWGRALLVGGVLGSAATAGGSGAPLPPARDGR